MSQPENNEISIVIRAYNEDKHISKLLRGILAQSIRNVEIILVDSGSTDGTVAIAESFPVRVVKIDPKDFTFGYSLNQWFPDTMLAQQPHPFCNKANAAIRKYYGRIIQSTKRCLVWKTWIGLTA